MELSPEVRLKRFLHITSETNVYKPGCRFFQKFFTNDCVPSLAELVQDGKEDVVFNIIKTVHEDKSSCHPEASLFVLAEMTKDVKIRQKTLEVAKLLCKKAESFIVFIKFSVEVKPSVGFGRMFRKFIQDWYLSKDYLPLAEIIGAMNRYRGWRHSDIIKLGHVKCDDPTKGASFKFATYGAEEMKKQYGEVEEAKKIVAYLCTVESYRKNKNAEEVASKIESYMLGKEHIDMSLLGEKKVWLALLRQMPVLQVLDHIQFMNKRKLFRGLRSWDAIFVDTVVEALTRPGANKTDVTVNKVFKTLINYENTARIKLELASKLKQLTKKPPVICPEVAKALIDLMNIMYEKVKPTGKKYFIAIESSQGMDSRRCQMSRYIMLVEAAGFIAHYFSQTEENVKVVTFTDTLIKPFPLSKEATVDQLIKSLKTTSINDNSHIGSPVKQKPKHSIINKIQEEMNKDEGDTDVCIIIKSMLDDISISAVKTLVENNTKNTRFVVCNLCGNTPKNCKIPDHPNLLVSFGFDDRMSEIISSFACEYY